MAMSERVFGLFARAIIDFRDLNIESSGQKRVHETPDSNRRNGFFVTNRPYSIDIRSYFTRVLCLLIAVPLGTRNRTNDVIGYGVKGTALLLSAD